MSADQDTPPAGGAKAAPRRTVRLWAPALMAALIVAAIWGPNLMRPPPPAWTVYNSVKGDIRRVVLADKSLMRLNGASQVRVVYEDDDRRAALGQAEAAFTIAPSERRPFLISAGDRVIRLDGGEINVLRETSQNRARTVLTVRSGQARVYPEDRAAEGTVVGPGQEAVWIDGEAPLQARRVNAANAFAWESHRLAYDKAPLTDVIADLNRYVARPIRIGDQSLADLPYTGVLALEGEDAMLRKLAQALPIEARPLPAEIVLERRAPGPPPAKPRRGALVRSLLKMNKDRPARLPQPAPPPTAPAP